MSVDFAGHDNRECGDHRTTGRRAWCFDCSEWCYLDDGCRGCRMPSMEEELKLLRDKLERVKRVRRRWTQANEYPRALRELSGALDGNDGA